MAGSSKLTVRLTERKVEHASVEVDFPPGGAGNCGHVMNAVSCHDTSVARIAVASMKQ